MLTTVIHLLLIWTADTLDYCRSLILGHQMLVYLKNETQGLTARVCELEITIFMYNNYKNDNFNHIFIYKNTKMPELVDRKLQ